MYMIEKIFVFGRPGSGKSTVISLIQTMATPTYCCSDYQIALELYTDELMNPNMTPRRRFRPALPEKPHVGFNVIDPLHSPIMRTVTQLLECEALRKIDENRLKGEFEVIALELARRDHRSALKQFSPSFLQNSIFILVEASVATCIERIRKRARDNGEQFMGDEIRY
jgi:dephospho-CoA kinase